MKLSLDHITVTDTTPAQLAELAAATGCSGICPFLHSMAVLPAMPDYDLTRDPAALRATRAALAADGLTVDLVYPFTLTGRSVAADFVPALDAAAELGAPLANVLCYDRDPVRRAETLVALAELAKPRGIALAIEFYPPSQVRTLAETLAVIDAADIASGGDAGIGITLDLLHVMRGGDVAASLALLAHPRVRIAQLADGPADMAADRIDWEAGIQRMLPGQGVFDIAGFVRALAPGVPVSIEAPRQSAIDAGVPALDRARAAVDATRAALSRAPA